MKRSLPPACWLYLLAACLIALSQARAAQPPPTTQKATISPTAFDPADPDVTPELAKAVETKRVTLDVKNMPALNAMAEIAKQTGYEIRPAHEQWFTGRQRGGNVTLNIQYQPFWVAVREVASRGNITLYNSGGDQGKAVQLAPGNYGYAAMRTAASIRGPFMVVLNHLQRINTVNMSSPGNTDRRVQLQVNTFVEPRISLSRVSYQAVIEEAVDDHGNSMMPTQQMDASHHMQSGRGIAWHGNFALPYPTTNPGSRIARIKGHFPATLTMASEPVEIPDPLTAKETTKTVGKRKITFKSFKKEQGAAYTLELVFSGGEGDPRQFHEMYNETIDLKLTDAQGRVYRFHNSGGGGSPEAMTRRFTFQSPRNTPSAEAGAKAEPTKLVIEVPTGREEIAIPFELVDLPLP